MTSSFVFTAAGCLRRVSPASYNVLSPLLLAVRFEEDKAAKCQLRSLLDRMSEVGGAGSSSSKVGSVNSKSRKNFPGNKSDIGWKHGADVQGTGRKVRCNYCSKVLSGGIFIFKHHLTVTREDCEPCTTIPEQVKALMLKTVAEAKEASMKKIKLIDVEDNNEEGQNDNSQTKEKNVLSLFSKGKAPRGGGGVQTTINQMVKKDLKPQVDEQVAQFFYTSVIPFNCIKNVEFAKMCEKIGQYGIGYKPPSYHEIREKLLKQAVTRTDAMLEDFKQE